MRIGKHDYRNIALGGLGSVRIQFLPILEEIGKSQNWKVSESEILTFPNSSSLSCFV